jgi:23S rRNA pseudouridine2605 synthase
MTAPDTTAPAKAERVAKLIARAGLCSRREAEKLIAERRVAVDGAVLETPGVTVEDPGRITVDGERLPRAEQARLFRYHKPRGLLTTNRDPKGRPTIFEALPKTLPRLVTVGRLDFTSEGLLLLTNDGALARHLELPATGWTRRYRVRVNGRVDVAKLAALAAGVTVDGVRYGPIEAKLDRQQGANAWLTVSLREGKNREVRRVLEHLGYPVSRLIRTAYGPFQLGALGDGDVEEVPQKVLREQVGLEFSPKGPAKGLSKRASKEHAKPPAKSRTKPPAKSHAKSPGESWAKSPDKSSTKPRAKSPTKLQAKLRARRHADSRRKA